MKAIVFQLGKVPIFLSKWQEEVDEKSPHHHTLMGYKIQFHTVVSDDVNSLFDVLKSIFWGERDTQASLMGIPKKVVFRKDNAEKVTYRNVCVCGWNHKNGFFNCKAILVGSTMLIGEKLPYISTSSTEESDLFVLPSNTWGAHFPRVCCWSSREL